jgi:hypothetical protein
MTVIVMHFLSKWLFGARPKVSEAYALAIGVVWLPLTIFFILMSR